MEPTPVYTITTKSTNVNTGNLKSTPISITSETTPVNTISMEDAAVSTTPADTTPDNKVIVENRPVTNQTTETIPVNKTTTKSTSENTTASESTSGKYSIKIVRDSVNDDITFFVKIKFIVKLIKLPEWLFLIYFRYNGYPSVEKPEV